MGPMDVYTDQEADRLSQIMVNDPHFAANELRGQLQQLDPQTASVLIAKTKNDEYVGGLGDLQIQVQYNQFGQDTGYRNVTMATQDGIEQIAELQANPYNGGYGPNPLGFVAGVIVGDLLWQQQNGMNFNDPRFYGWCNREQGREQYWNQNNGQFQQNWGNPNFRSQYQDQNWQQSAYQPTQNNTYINNSRINTTTMNNPVNNTTINETINNSRTTIINNDQTYNHAPHQTIAVPGHQPIVVPPHQVIMAPPAAAATARPGYTGGAPAHQFTPTAAPTPGQIARPGGTLPERPPAAAPGQYHAPVGTPAAPAAAERAPAPNALAQQQALQAQRDQIARDNAARALQQQQETARENAARALQQQQEIARENAARQAHPPAAQAHPPAAAPAAPARQPAAAPERPAAPAAPPASHPAAAKPQEVWDLKKKP